DGGIAALHDLLHTGHARDLGSIEALNLAAEDRAFLHRRAQHTGELYIDPVERLAGELVHGVEPLERLAGNLPVLRVLELHLLRWCPSTSCIRAPRRRVERAQ